MQEDVQFARLGLVVWWTSSTSSASVSGARFRRLGVDPHYLVTMTATPIPRTVALSVFGDLDVSVMKQLPPGRRPVATRWQPADQRERVYTRLREAMTAGRQGYIVCPLVEESAVLDVKAATETYAELQAGPFHDFRLGLLHGRQDEAVKDEVMRQFRAGEIQFLVCTTVIEVGIESCRMRRSWSWNTCAEPLWAITIASTARPRQPRHDGGRVPPVRGAGQ